MASPTAPTRPTAYGVLGILPGLIAAAWIAGGVGLLLVSEFHWWLAVPVFAVLLALLVWLVPPRLWRAPAGPRWALVLTLAIVVVAGVWALQHSSENLVVRRDPGPYGLIASWVAQHASMQIPTSAAVFGNNQQLQYATPAFYVRPGGVLQPQFLSGLPVTLAPADWIGGIPWLLRANAVIGAFALLTFASFTARVVGPRAAPFATAVLAIAYPETHAFRSAYSEPLTQLLVFGGLCLLWDANHRVELRSRGVAVAGAVLGVTAAVRLDALADLLPLAGLVVVYAVAKRGRDALALVVGLAVGVAIGLADGFRLHSAYLNDTGSQLSLVGWGFVAAVIGIAVAVPLGRRVVDSGTWQRLSEPARRRLAVVAVVVPPAVVLFAYFVRPLLPPPHSPPSDGTAKEVGALQVLQHLPVDPHRTYAEQSMHWMGWWIGLPAILLAAVGVGLIVRRWLSGRDADLLPLVGLGVCVASLVFWRPSITPDHPWADRRFVPIVLPAMVLLATWSLAELAKRHRWRPAVAVLALAVLVPGLVTTWPLANTRTETGQLAALHRLCAAIPSDAAVLFVDTDLAFRWAPAVRDECGVPTGFVPTGTAVPLADVRSAVSAHGRTLVLVGGSAAELAGHDAKQVVDLTYPVDQRTLTRRPHRTGSEHTNVWVAAVS